MTQGWLNHQLDRAHKDHYDAAVIVLDTPGGLEDSMRKIVQKELQLSAAGTPVIVYVSPRRRARGVGRASGSPQAADVLAMAPETNIGSSTPIDGSGANIGSDLRRKIINDAAASLRGLAKTHGRNAAWAEQGRPGRLEPHRRGGPEDERDRHDRADPAGAPRQDRRLDDRARSTSSCTPPAPTIDETKPGLPHALPLDAHSTRTSCRCSSCSGSSGSGSRSSIPGSSCRARSARSRMLLALFGLYVLPLSWTGARAGAPRPRAPRARPLRAVATARSRYRG